MTKAVDVLLWLIRNIIWINIGLAAIVVFFERRNPKSTWLWIMVLTFLPGIGFLLYLVLGQDLSKKKIFQEKRVEDLLISDLAKLQYSDMLNNRFDYKNMSHKEYEDLMKMHLVSSQSIVTQDNNVEIYYEGKEKFQALIDAINAADEYILLQYYIIKSDYLGMKIIDALCKKAKEGVKVKVLYDGMGGRNLSRPAIRKMENAGVEVAVFFPPFASKLTLRINYRNHRKICVIDGNIGFVGGFNIGDEYIGLYEKFGHWRDTHIKIEGSAVTWLQWRFLLDWRFSVEELDYGIFKSHIRDDTNMGNVAIQIVSSGPDSRWPSVKDGYLKMISEAKEKLYIETPYFIPDDAILEALRVSALGGTDVRIMIPNKPDHPFVYWASLSYIGELLNAGVRCYAYERGFLHSKVVIMDDEVSSVGTANMDIRSFDLNFEVNAFLYDKETNFRLSDNFIKDIKYCREITLEDYNNRSSLVKVKESFSRLLSPIL